MGVIRKRIMNDMKTQLKYSNIGMILKILLVSAFIVLSYNAIQAQPYTVTPRENMSGVTAISECGSGVYTFSFTQSAYNTANMQLFNNGTRINITSWSKTDCAYLGWGDDRIGAGLGAPSTAITIYVLFYPATTTISMSTSAPDCGPPSAEVSVSTSFLSGFSYCAGAGASASQSYTVSGANLTDDITITAPTNYEISLNNSSFSNSVDLSHSGGIVNATTMYVRLKAGLSVGTYNSEQISHTSDGATTKTVSCNGTVHGSSSVVLASASQIPPANVEQASSKVALSAFTLAISSNTANIESITFSTSGTYVASDVSKFQLWYNTTNSLSGASQIGSDITISLGVGSHSFVSLSQSVASGTTGYYWIITNIQAAAAVGNAIAVSSISTGDITILCGSLSGSITAGGTQTITAATRITYYSRATGDWNSNNTWSTEGCGGTAVGVGVYPTVTDNVIICTGNTVTANVDIVTTGSVAVNSGGTLTVNNSIEIDAAVTIETGATMNWPSTIEIGSNANIIVNGNISAGSTTIVYQDPYDGISKGKITATGTMAFSQVRSASSVKGGSLKASSITIGTFGQNEVGVDVAFDGPTTISTYMGYGYTYFTNGNLTITNYNSTNSSSITTNEIVSNNSDLIFTNKPVAKNTALLTNIQGDIYFNAGFENAYTGTPSTRLIANNIYITNSLKGEGGTNLYIQANVIQQGNVAINQNSNGNIYIQKDFNSNGYTTNFDNTNATFKVEGNSRFDNITGHLNSTASIITLGNSYMKGSGTFGPNDGSIYVGGFLTVETLQVSFQGTAKGYIGGAFTSAEFESGGVYASASYDASTVIGGSGFHPRNGTNDPDAAGGNYLSYKGGQITSSDMISNLTIGASLLDVEPENWELPITLLSFIAYKIHNGVELRWEIASEKNNDFFTIYRSNNGLQFESIGTLSGAGTTNVIHEYSFTDYSIFGGMTYYTLAQTDYDGKTSFSRIISVYEKLPNFELTRFVNSESSHCLFEVQFADYEASNDLLIINALGAVVFEQVFTNTIFERIQLHLQPGVYSLINISNNTTKTIKVIVK